MKNFLLSMIVPLSIAIYSPYIHAQEVITENKDNIEFLNLQESLSQEQKYPLFEENTSVSESNRKLEIVSTSSYNTPIFDNENITEESKLSYVDSITNHKDKELTSSHTIKNSNPVSEVTSKKNKSDNLPLAGIKPTYTVIYGSLLLVVTIIIGKCLRKNS